MKKREYLLISLLGCLLLTACGVSDKSPAENNHIPLPPAEEAHVNYDERCELYLKVLEDLWNVDSALNHEAVYLGFDFTQTSLADTDITHIAETFASAHEATPLIGTAEDLIAEGYLIPDEYKRVTYWEDGLLLSITEHEDGTFSAQKWRSSLGAYVFSKCTASNDGTEYTIGAEVIA